jgi:methionyl-tRNA formyltransferase
VLRATLYAPDAESDASRALGVHVRDGRLLLLCREGTLELLEVKPPGGKPMDGGAFLRGHDLPEG